MKHTSSHRRGFTLVEMLVVIAIIAVLVAIIIPTVRGIVERARWATCQADMRTLRGEYATWHLSNDVNSTADGKKLLQQLAESHHATFQEGGNGGQSGLHGNIQGLCPSGGVYVCSFSNGFSTMYLECSVHGGVKWDIVHLSDAIDALQFPNYVYANVGAYFNRNPSLNSEAISTDTAYRPYGSFAEAVEENLAQQGVFIKDRTWRMNGKNGKATELYLAEVELKLEMIPNPSKEYYVKCEQFQIGGSGEPVSGYMRVKIQSNSGGKYPYLDGFVATLPTGDNVELITK